MSENENDSYKHGPYQSGISPDWANKRLDPTDPYMEKWAGNEISKALKDYASRLPQQQRVQEIGNAYMGIGGAGGGKSNPAAPAPSYQESEYLVIILRAGSDPAIYRCKDTEEMQTAKNAGTAMAAVTDIIVFKRMIRLKSKVEWEPVEADL